MVITSIFVGMAMIFFATNIVKVQKHAKNMHVANTNSWKIISHF